MNLNDAVLVPGKNNKIIGLKRREVSTMGPPVKSVPKKKSRLGSSRTSDLPWGKSHTSLILNSSSNKKSTPSRSTTDSDEDRIIVAITEGRGEARCEVGLAAINVSRPVLILCQTSDSQSYTNTLTKLNIFNPHLILYPVTFETGRGNRLIAEIRRRFPNKKLLTVPRKSFNKANGLDRLYKICISSAFPLLIMIKNRYYALAAASGLLTYLQDNMYIYYASNSIKLDYQASEGYTIIDIATADRLELVCSNQPAQANKYSSLFGIMNRCLTRVGTRNLRSIILQPLYYKQKIDERLNCVEELIRNPEVLLSIQSVLPKLSSVDQLLSISTLVPEDPHRCNNRQLNYLLLLNGIVDTLQPLKEALKNTSQPFFVQLKGILEDQNFDLIKKLIRETIHEEAYSAKGQYADQQRIWAIKPGLNGLLDLVRKTYSERIEDMREYINELGQKHNLPLTLANNNKKGYHIILTLNQNQKRHMKKSDLPVEFIQVFRLANNFTMKTAELVNLSTRIDDILTDLFTLSNLMIHHIIVKVKEYAVLFYKLVEGISYLDILQSLAEASYANNWIRPKFDEYTDVTFGRHPLLDFLCQKKPVSNPVIACEHYNLHIITGPNGAGKSIFIRQLMLLQIMAQAGCFVPAQTAIFKPADKMFARISNDDDMESNASSFVLEMTEVNYILTTMTDRSLIIIDELCRSTSVEEGTAIAMLICEELAKSRAYTFVTTHFTLLTKLADLFFNIKVWQLQTIPRGDPTNPMAMKLDFKFSLEPGATTLRGYGIYMVRGIWPREVMQHVDELQERHIKNAKDPKFPSLSQRVRLRYDLNCKVYKLKLQKNFTLANLHKQIDEYNKEMEKIGGEDVEFSQNILQHFQRSADEASNDLDHSIFDASRVEPSIQELSKLFLDDFSDTRESSCSPNTKNQEINEDARILFSPMESQDNVQTPISPSKAKERMLEIFTPDTKLDISQSTYKTCSFADLSPNNLEPEVCLSVNYSQCSLNLTQEALEQDDQNLHAQTQSDEEHVYGFLPTTRVSQKLPPNLPPVLESPFISTFLPPLQDDSRKTSTPLITKINYNAKNFGTSPSLSTSTVSKRCPEVKHVTTPKITFTIPLDAMDLDIASVAEDLESFAEEVENEEINYRPLEDYSHRSENRGQEMGLRESHVFPIVKIIQGPNNPSSDECINSSPQDACTVIKPIVKNIQQKIINSPEIQKCPEISATQIQSNNITMDEASDIIWKPKEPVVEACKRSLKNKHNKEKHEVGKHIQLQNDMELMIQAFNSISKGKRSESDHSIVANIKSTGETKDENMNNDKASEKDTQHTSHHTYLTKDFTESEQHKRNIGKRDIQEAENIETIHEKYSQDVSDGVHIMVETFKSLSNEQLVPKAVTNDKEMKHEITITRETKKAEQLTNNSNIMLKTYSEPIGGNNAIMMEKSRNTNETDIEMREAFNSISILHLNNQNSRQNSQGQEQKTFRKSPNSKKTLSLEIKTEYKDEKVIAVDKNDLGKCETENIYIRSLHEQAESDEDIYETAESSGDFSYSPLVPQSPDGEINSAPDFKDKSADNAENSKNALLLDNKSNATLEECGKSMFIRESSGGNENAEQNNGVLESNTENCIKKLHTAVVDRKHRFSYDKGMNKSYDTDYERTTEKYLSSQSYEDAADDTETEHFVDKETKGSKLAINDKECLKVQASEEAAGGMESATEKSSKSIQFTSEKKGSNSLVTENIKEFDTYSQDHNENTLETHNRDVVEEKPEEKMVFPSTNSHIVEINVKDTHKPINQNKVISDKSAFNSSHSDETKEKTTSISEASKLRNLDGDFSSSSTSTNMAQKRNKNPHRNEAETSVNSLSEASRKRNLDLDESSTSSADKGDGKGNVIALERSQQRKKRKLFRAPLKKHNTPTKTIILEDNSLVSSDSSSKNKWKNDSSSDQLKTKFVDPCKLSKKAIREAFLEQDKKFFESSGNSQELTRMWEERLKRPARPTPHQIQRTECLATIRKTNEGVEVIPTEKPKTRMHGAQKRILSLTSSGSMNMNIFSDQNAETFDKFIKSDKKDYKSFNFQFGPKSLEDDGKMFDFKQAKTASSEYTHNSQSWTFVRKRSEDYNAISQLNTNTNFSRYLSPANDFSLTPDGFYKQNKEDIISLIRKYN